LTVAGVFSHGKKVTTLHQDLTNVTHVGNDHSSQTPPPVACSAYDGAPCDTLKADSRMKPPAHKYVGMLLPFFNFRVDGGFAPIPP
jgi:hypothetical protein